MKNEEFGRFWNNDIELINFDYGSHMWYIINVLAHKNYIIL